MTNGPTLVYLRAVVKGAGGPAPIRVDSLEVGPSDRIVIAGADRATAELFVHLITGAAVPDEGTVSIAGVDTRSIATDTEWLGSLDRFGLVSDRAVLLDSLPVAANLAIPLTLAIEPMSVGTRTAVEALALEVGMRLADLDQPMGSLDALARLRAHLARALANRPELLLLEEPTSGLPDRTSREEFGRALRLVADSRPVGWLAFSNDDDFIRESAGTVLRFDSKAGELGRARRWWFWGGRRRGA